MRSAQSRVSGCTSSSNRSGGGIGADRASLAIGGVLEKVEKSSHPEVPDPPPELPEGTPKKLLNAPFMVGRVAPTPGRRTVAVDNTGFLVTLEKVV